MDKKKLIMVVVVIVCLGLAVAITFMRNSDKAGVASLDSSEKVWVKCNNPSCGAEYQISAREYFETTDKNRKDPLRTPPLLCQKCKQESIFLAKQCDKCKKIFFPSPAKGDYPDRCTYCGYSRIEELKKRVSGSAPAGK